MPIDTADKTKYLQHMVADAVWASDSAKNLPQNLSILEVTVAVLAMVAVFASGI